MNEQLFLSSLYESHRATFSSDREAVERYSSELRERFVESSAEPRAALAELARSNDPEAFRERMQSWAVLPTSLAFNGFSGQMLLNQLVKNAPDTTELAGLLVDVLGVPADLDEAVAKLVRLTSYIESIRVGAHPAPGHAPFLASYFWALGDRKHLPIAWSSATSFVQFLTGESGPESSPERYRWFAEIVQELSDDAHAFERVAIWWDDNKIALVDESLVERCEWAADEEGKLTDEERVANARVLLAVAKHIASTQAESLSDVIGRDLLKRTPPLNWVKGFPRADSYVTWATDDWLLGLRLWIWSGGVAIGLTPGEPRPGWNPEAAEIVTRHPLDGYRLIGTRGSSVGEDLGLAGRAGSFIYAKVWEKHELADLDLPAALAEAAVALQPLLHELRVAAGAGVDDVPENDPLAHEVERFFAERNYPTEADKKDRSDQIHFRELLDPANIRTTDIAELRLIWNTGRYGGPGPQSHLNTALRDADAAEYDRIIESIQYACWGEGADSERIDRLLQDDTLKVKGLGESVILKLLAICHPERYVPIFPYTGWRGKLKMLNALDLAEPQGTRGELQVESNRLLHERLSPYFPNDPWGMARFLYWYLEAGEVIDESEEVDILGDLAEELFVDREFLERIVKLLEDKGQVIFYGPPGTGKTYLARKLAEAVAPDPQRRSLVQFHPSTSYEDFFEGFRPESVGDGDLTYRLTPGPLALLADMAAEAPGRQHVMIIDEINRANLPKVFGELLFLLEYRGESVQTLYRPEAPFQLPPKDDLWFIGTMNTADRSIALIDAAMRRRFHFVPFFPNDGAMAPLLDRWLAQNQPDAAWVGELLSQVNDELEDALGGPHLQIGPSHFMRPALDVDEVQLIWESNIEPFIEDQFFGNSSQIERFRFAAVHKRYLELSGRGDLGELEQAEVEAGDGDSEE